MFAMLDVFSNFPCRGIFGKEDEEAGRRMANIENAGKVSRIGNGTTHFQTFPIFCSHCIATDSISEILKSDP